MNKGINSMDPKSKKRISHRTTFYSIFNISSCYCKPELQNDLPEITKIK